MILESVIIFITSGDLITSISMKYSSSSLSILFSSLEINIPSHNKSKLSGLGISVINIRSEEPCMTYFKIELKILFTYSSENGSDSIHNDSIKSYNTVTA